MKLAEALDSYIPTPERAIDGAFLMPVEDVFSISGRGTVVTGRVERGVIKVGEEIEIVGITPTQKTICTGVEMFRKLLDQGQAGDNVGILLRGTKREEVQRGQVLCKPASVKPHTHFTAEIYVLSKEEGGRHTPFFNNYRPQFYFRTTDVTGAVELRQGQGDGDAGRQRLHHRQADQPRSPWKRACASPSAKAAEPSAPASWRRSWSDDRTQQGRSSIGRALVSKTRGWGFDALRPCHRQDLNHSTGASRRRAPTEHNMANPTSPPVETVSTGADKAKLAVAGVLVVAAVVAFYVLGQQDLWLRVAALLALMIVAVATFFTSEPGKQLIAYGQDSIREVKKVVWPTRKEALQMTGYVFAFVVVMALFLWLTDKTLEWVLYDLVPRLEALRSASSDCNERKHAVTRPNRTRRAPASAGTSFMRIPAWKRPSSATCASGSTARR